MKKIRAKYRHWFYHPNPWIEGGVVLLLLLATAAIFTWPLASHFGLAIPSGSEPPTVAMFQLFVVEWTGKVLDEGLSYWNAPFFYPYQGALAWTEPQPFSGILVWLAGKLTGYIPAYNILVLLYLAGFGLAGYMTTRLCTGDRTSSLWCAVWLTAGAYALQQICALNLIAVVFPLGCLFFAFLFVKTKKYRFFWSAVLFYLLTWATSKQFAFFLAILFPFALAPFLSHKKINRKTAGHCFIAFGIILAIVLPYSLRQFSYLQQMGFSRALRNITAVFTLKHLFMPAGGHWLTTRLLGWKAYSRDIGIVPLLVILLSVFKGIFKSHALDAYQKKLIAGLSAMVIVALGLGFGPKLGLVIKGRNYGPYAFLFSFVPGFDVLRAPARFGMFVTFGIAVLAAAALAYIRKQVKSARMRHAVTATVFALLFAEMWTMPINLIFPNKEIDGHQQAIAWLRQHAGGEPVLELPLPARFKLADLELNAAAMLRMLRHGNPILNGYASFHPLPFEQLILALASDPGGRGRRYLDAYGVRYLFVHNDKLPDEERIRLGQALGNDVVYQDSGHSIYLLPEKKHIQDIRQFLPLKAKFQEPPQKEKIYRLALSKPVVDTVLVMPQQQWRIDFEWQDDSGEGVTKKMRMRGSALIDVARPELFFRIIRFPGNKRDGEARLISAEEVEKSPDENILK